MDRKLRIIISGGGTGGHIFPAVSIASELKAINAENEILFVGAEGKMEMEKVPAAGFRIIGLPILGLQRRLNFKNLMNDIKVPFKLAKSLRMARKVIREFKPDIAIGVGGYASAPLLYAATRLGVPTLIQEQNGFAGLTNRILGRKAGKICVAYEGMEKFFPAEKIVMTGNPIRKDIVPPTESSRKEAETHYGMDPSKKHILVIGGSLGSGTLNKAMRRWIEQGCPGGGDADVLWQCGKYYKEGIDRFMEQYGNVHGVKHQAFIDRMDLAYAMADVVISRSGASSVSEICAAHKAAVFVPSPNVAEDHQTHNAMALSDKDAAVTVRDSEAEEKLLGVALNILEDDGLRERLGRNAGLLARTDAARVIAEEVYKMTGNV